MRELTFTISAEDDGKTALNILRARGFSQRSITKLKHGGGLTRGGVLLRTVDRVSAGDVIRAVMSDSSNESILPNPDIKAAAVYEDEDVIVYDKPPFLPVHPSIRHGADTLANLYAAAFPDAPFRAINRLDKNTSGLCVCAKNAYAAPLLAKSLSKVYFAVVDGIIEGCGEIDLPIGRTGDSIIKRAVRADGQRAVTRYNAVLHKNGRTLLEITLKTGRTHQIRVHFSHIGFPLCGDEMYGGDLSAIERQALHCGRVAFSQPVTGERIALESALPEDIRSLME
ncbi:MAG: RluA family pseudouridine synthase [Lachnospiraceae bacterium]|nr:RluA family pseudouridine synthase [Ruminococcus sp.]MCM1274245.1 RluA family pseudouridine synthase [Lachnospiraceae bacterium]